MGGARNDLADDGAGLHGRLLSGLPDTASQPKDIPTTEETPV